MNDLEKSFAAAKMAKDSSASRAASLDSQMGRFSYLLADAVEELRGTINGNPEMLRQVRGPLKTMHDDTVGYTLYQIEFPVIQVTYKNHGKHFTIDLFKKEYTPNFGGRPKRVRTEKFTFELGPSDELQLRSTDGVIFTEIKAFAQHILEPFWMEPL